jgi:hypothetical protein
MNEKMAGALCAWVLCGALAACGDPTPEAEPGAAPPQSPAFSPPPPVAADAPPDTTTPRCVGPGSTREQVRAVLGEPDSIVGGWWHYGRTQFHLGSGTVQDYISGGNVPFC